MASKHGRSGYYRQREDKTDLKWDEYPEITKKVTRLTVIDHTKTAEGFDRGAGFERHGVKVELMLQDDGRTLKVRMVDND